MGSWHACITNAKHAAGANFAGSSFARTFLDVGSHDVEADFKVSEGEGLSAKLGKQELGICWREAGLLRMCQVAPSQVCFHLPLCLLKNHAAGSWHG